MALYRFFQSKERPVIPTLSLAKKEQQKSFWEHGRPQWLHALRPRHKYLVNCRSISYRLAARRSWSSIYRTSWPRTQFSTSTTWVRDMRAIARIAQHSPCSLASFPGRFCGGEENRPGHHCWSMRVVPIKTWEFVHVCTLSAYTLVISRNISVHDYECLSVLLQLRER